jgi:recombination protein RecA
MLSWLWKIITPLASKNNTTIYINNQIRFNTSGYGSPKTTPGGAGLRYGVIARLELSKDEHFKSGGIEVGHTLKIYAEKNQIGKPFKSTFVSLLWGEGIDYIDSTVEMSVFADVIKQGGAWYTLPNGTKLQGKPAVVSYYKEHDDEYRDLYDETYKQVMNRR